MKSIMLSFGKALLQAREAAGLSTDEFARLSGLPADTLIAWEGGKPADAKGMDRCSLVMGVRLTDFLKGEAARADASLLFKKSTSEFGREQVLTLDEGLGLSRFSRIVYELSDLRMLLGHSASSLPDLSRQYEARPRESSSPGDYLALAARRALQFDLQSPIGSMRGVLERLGIPLLISAQGEVDPRISGASILHPIPAVLLVPAWASPWVTRMTLAHELCHLLFHRAGLSVSPDSLDTAGAPGWRLDAEYATREQEANAFAAAFLAPAYAIREHLHGIRPDGEQGIRRVGSHFRVGKRVAVNRIVDTFGLSESRRQTLLSMNVTWAPADGDGIGHEEGGLFQGELRKLTAEALGQGLISKTRARANLGVPDEEPLELETLIAEQRAPVVSAAQMIARRCQSELWKSGLEYLAEDVEVDGTGFRVTLNNTRGERMGHVSVDQEGKPRSAPVVE